MMPSFRTCRSVRLALVFCVILALSPAQAADPIRQSLRILPPDAAIGFVVSDLAKTSQTIQNSPFWSWFQQSTFGRELLQSPDIAALAQLDPFLEANLGTSIAELRSDIFGDLIAFAYQPENLANSTPEQAVLLVRPRKPKRLQELLHKLNQAQLQAKDVLKINEKKHAGQFYIQRVKRQDGERVEADYYSLIDGILLFSSDERSLQAALSRQTSLPTQTEVEHHLAREWDRFGQEPPLLLAWLNPRAFDAELQAKVQAAAEQKLEDAAFLKQFSKLWQGTTALTLSVHAKAKLELRVQARFQADRLPKELSGLLVADSRPGDPFPLPEQAILGLGGRLNVPQVLDALSSFFPGQPGNSETRIAELLGPIVGKQRLTRVLQTIGPNWSFWVDPPAAGSAEPWPDWTLAVQLGEQKPPPQELTRGLSQLLDYHAQLLRVQYNRTHADQLDFTEETRESRQVKLFTSEGTLPFGWRPGYGFHQNYLVIASRPERIWDFAVPPASRDASPVLLRFSSNSWRNYLQAHRKPLSRQLAAWSGQSAESIAGQLKQLDQLFELFKTVELVHDSQSGHHEFRLIVELAKPLRP